ncbi:histone-like nucleoid-structuring protein Lsr2 [Rhodococcoides fascians]|uniref:histone-like nucleoid-structuring protein Lsr2 n=1 Tax=Rhodococcoides fascians TaxID=1828 RepID=UPI001E001CD8|nr:Lsr2 family protein [Rhodococcus fascians]CAH0191339.1 Nucleoid-associated protein Lsr2 [Rhodococcus fascians]
MARQEITTYIVTDDFDGKDVEPELAHLVDFSFEGEDYKIELRPENYDKLKKDMQKWIAAGTPVKSKRGRKTLAAGTSSTPKKPSRTDLQDIRDWAKKQGIDVSDRGRIAQSVQDQYDAAKK